MRGFSVPVLLLFCQQSRPPRRWCIRLAVQAQIVAVHRQHGARRSWRWDPQRSRATPGASPQKAPGKWRRHDLAVAPIAYLYAQRRVDSALGAMALTPDVGGTVQGQGTDGALLAL